MLAWALERAKARGAHTVAIYANARNATANAFIRRLGFLPMGSSWVLYAPSDLTLDEPLWPDGYSARSYAEVGQLATLTDIFYRGYHDLYGHSENTRVPTEQEMADWLSSADPEAVFLALAPSGDAAGICTVYLADTPDDYQGEQSAEQEQARDLIDAPGVAQEYRGMGIHRPLLLTALHWQRAHGERPLTLESWGDSEETIAIYRSIGFSLMQRYIAYHHDLILSDWH